MNIRFRTNRNLIFASVTFYILLIVLSFLFFKERIAFLDIAYHLFFILKEGDFAIQNGRIGAFFTQLFPLLGAHAGFSLPAVGMLYSVSFVLYQLLTFLIIFKGLRNTQVAISWLLFGSLITTHTFFWIQSELSQGAAYLFILLALVHNALLRKEPKLPAIAVLLFIFAAFTHPLLVFPFCFLIGFLMLSFPQYRRWLLSLAAVYITLFIAKNILLSTFYEAGAMGGLKNIFTRFPDYFTLQSNKNFLGYLLRDYYFLPVVLVLISIFYFRKRRFLKLIWITGFFIGYTFIVNISYPDGGSQFYLENQYLLLAVMVGVPLAFDILPAWKAPYPLALISGILLLCLFRIYRTETFYAQRLQWNRNLLQKTALLPDKKLIVPATVVPMDTLLMTWASSYEFWLLSTLESGESRCLIIEEKPGEFDWAMPANNSFISKWGVFNYSEFNPKYFSFKDTSSYHKSQP